MKRWGPPTRPSRRRAGPTWRAAVTVAATALWAAAGVPGTATAAGGREPPMAKAKGQPAPGASGSLDAVSCGSASVCWAVGLASPGPHVGKASAGRGVVDGTVDGGRTWRAHMIEVAGPANLMAVDCANPHACMAVGDVEAGGSTVALAVATTDHGRRWHAVHAPAGATDLVAVACSDAHRCTAVASQGPTYWAADTVDGGGVWQRLGTLPGGLAGVSSLTCTAAGTCLVAGYTPTTPGKGAAAVAISTDSGTTWSAATVPSGAGPLHDVTCRAPTECLAVGTTSPTTIGVAQGRGEVLSSNDGGGTWTTAAVPTSVDDAFGVACPSATSCAVVGTRWTSATPPSPAGGVAASVDGGSAWTHASVRYLPVGLAAVSCPSATRCVGAGNDELARIALPPAPHGHHSGR